MNINATLLGQMITFAVFVWFTVKFIWPPMIKAMRERRQRIADGLAAANRGQRELALAERQIKQLLGEAKLEASHIIERANERAVQITEDAKEQARQESKRLVENAHKQIEQQTNNARDKLRADVIELALAGAAKVIGTDIDRQHHEAALQKLAEEL